MGSVLLFVDGKRDRTVDSIEEGGVDGLVLKGSGEQKHLFIL